MDITDLEETKTLQVLVYISEGMVTTLFMNSEMMGIPHLMMDAQRLVLWKLGSLVWKTLHCRIPPVVQIVEMV